TVATSIVCAIDAAIRSSVSPRSGPDRSAAATARSPSSGELGLERDGDEAKAPWEASSKPALWAQLRVHDARGEVRRVARVVQAHSGNGHARGHLDDAQDRVEPARRGQVTGQRDADHR